MAATATSTGDTKQKKPDEGSKAEKGHIDTRITPLLHGNTSRCSSSSRRTVTWRPWLHVEPLVRWLEKQGADINRVLNEAVLFWACGEGDEQFRLRVKKAQLLNEEKERMQTMRVILRSGAFLDSYATKLVEGDEKSSVKLGRQPLSTLASPQEVGVVRRLLARREAIVKELIEIEEKLLPEKEYVLKSERVVRSARRRLTENKVVES